MRIGTTYNHRHAQYLKLERDKAVSALLDFGFDIIRLGCYWEEIEREQGKYDFSAVIPLLSACERAGQKVVMTIGMKGPRWPEFYFPVWLRDKTPAGAEPHILSFLEAAITALRDSTSITHWQVENEPLDPSGPEALEIPPALLGQEVRLVKKLDKRPVVVNLWGNELSKRNLLPSVPPETDIIGLDLYYKVPIIGRLYRGPRDSDVRLKKIIEDAGKPVWITEFQAEPWESSFLVARSDKTPSMNPGLLRKNYERVSLLGAEAIFFWGFEYWLWKKEQGDPSLWNAAKEILDENKERRT